MQIPIVVDGRENTAELVVGLGNYVLVGPQSSDGNDPDFSAQAQNLRAHPFYPKPKDRPADADDDEFESWNLDVDFDAAPRH